MEENYRGLDNDAMLLQERKLLLRRLTVGIRHVSYFFVGVPQNARFFIRLFQESICEYCA